MVVWSTVGAVVGGVQLAVQSAARPPACVNSIVYIPIVRQGVGRDVQLKGRGTEAMVVWSTVGAVVGGVQLAVQSAARPPR
jgi:hypothetical protein